MTWQVLHVRPRSEKKLAQHCSAYGITYYLPLREETKIYQRRKVSVEKPVFPCYFFASLHRDAERQLQRTNHILRKITPISEENFLSELAQVRQALAVDPTLASCRALKKGKMVRILAGPFMGIEGMISALKPNSKVRLNVDLIGRAVAVEVDREFLELVD